MKECGLESGEQLVSISCFQPCWEETGLTLKGLLSSGDFKILFLAISGVSSLLLAVPSYYSDLPKDMGGVTSLSRILMNILHLYNTEANISFDRGKPKQ